MSSFDRRILLAAMLVLTLHSVVGVAEAASDDAGKPNIVLVLMDNFGYGEIGGLWRRRDAWRPDTPH